VRTRATMAYEQGTCGNRAVNARLTRSPRRVVKPFRMSSGLCLVVLPALTPPTLIWSDSCTLDNLKCNDGPSGRWIRRSSLHH